MMNSFLKISLWFFVLCTINAFSNAKFLNEQKPCNYGDTDCIVKMVNFYMQEKSGGDSSLNLVPLDPLSINKIEIKQGAESPVNINLVFSKNKVIGLKDVNAYKVKGFGKDLKQKHEIFIKLKHVSLVGDYTIKGKVLILPISGAGKSNITLVDADIGLHFSGTPYEKDGATYMKIENMKITAEPERVHYFFGNLFNGDKALGDNMNLFLNENWHEIYLEVRDSLTQAFARIFEQILSKVFSKYPYEKYFIE